MRVWSLFNLSLYTGSVPRSLAVVAALCLGALLGVATAHAATARDGDDAAGTPSASPQDAPTTSTRPSAHVAHALHGWTVRVDDRLLAPPHEELGRLALRFLEGKLFDIQAVVAPEPLEKLKAVAIVLDLNHGDMKPMGYHPSAGWLRANGYATDLAKCVHLPVAADLATPRNIIEQPWVILHELAHAYHDQVLGFDEPRIQAAYEAFKEGGGGEQALRYDGARTRHYGLTDQKEFFAEMSESYFGVNDFFPFNRAELMTAEPEVYELMRAIWGPVPGAPKR